MPSTIEASALFSALIGDSGPSGGIPRTFDLDSVSKEFIAEARRQDARRRWETDCPPEYRNTDFNHSSLVPYHQQIYQILNWVPGGKGLLASGPTGRGKTRSLWALNRHLAFDLSLEVRYWHASDWFSELQQQVHYGRDDALRWVERVAKRPWVFLDDLGQEAVTGARQEWAQGWLLRFLDIRIENGLPLFVTTNLNADSLAASYGGERGVRSDPLIGRLLRLCAVVRFETEIERKAKEVRA